MLTIPHIIIIYQACTAHSHLQKCLECKVQSAPFTNTTTYWGPRHQQNAKDYVVKASKHADLA